MSRRIGSYFYKSKPNTTAIRRKRWNIPSLLWRIIKKACFAIGALVLFSLVMGIIGGVMLGGARKSLPNDMILVFNVTDPITESAAQPTLTDPLAGDSMTVHQVISAIDKGARDSRVRGLLVSLDNGGLELTHVQELRDAVKRFRQEGKFAHIYTASFADLGSGIGAYYLASAFDEIWMQPVGFVSVTGVAIEMPFAKKALDRLGVKAQFLHREEFKSAMEAFTNEEMSAPNAEMMTSILKDFSTKIFTDIAADKSFKTADLQAQIDKGLLTGDEAKEAGLITNLAYSDKLVDDVREKITGQKKGDEPPLVDITDYYRATKERKNKAVQPDVALVYIQGEIIPGSEPRPGYATGDYIAQAIHEAGDNPAISVILIRIDSPGGSPTASETIRHAIVYAKEQGKKIIVSMGPVAASGGYWIAVDADKIYALPSTLTGSIGVIMGKFEAGELWDKLGINWQTLQWGNNAGFWSMNKPFNDVELARLNTVLDDTYTSFIDRVAQGRKLKPEYVRSIAKGRAWTGRQAKQNGLVDELGSMEDAMNFAAKLAGKTRRTMSVIEVPEPQTPFEQIMKLMGREVSLGNFLKFDSHVSEQILPLMHQMEAMSYMGPVQAYDPGLYYLGQSGRK